MELGIQTHSVGKPINVQFAKGDLHEIKNVALHITL